MAKAGGERVKTALLGATLEKRLAALEKKFAEAAINTGPFGDTRTEGTQQFIVASKCFLTLRQLARH